MICFVEKNIITFECRELIHRRSKNYIQTNRATDENTQKCCYICQKKNYLERIVMMVACLLACLGTLIHAHRYGIETRLSSITLMRLLFVDCALCTLTQSKSTSRTIFAISSIFERNPNWNMLIELFDFAISRAVCVYVYLCASVSTFHGIFRFIRTEYAIRSSLCECVWLSLLTPFHTSDEQLTTFLWTIRRASTTFFYMNYRLSSLFFFFHSFSLSFSLDLILSNLLLLIWTLCGIMTHKTDTIKRKHFSFQVFYRFIFIHLNKKPW